MRSRRGAGSATVARLTETGQTLIGATRQLPGRTLARQPTTVESGVKCFGWSHRVSSCPFHSRGATERREAAWLTKKSAFGVLPERATVSRAENLVSTQATEHADLQGF